MSRSATLVAIAMAVLAARAGAGGGSRTQITVWATTPQPGIYGGLAYGGYPPVTGAMITEQHVVDVAGDARISGVAATLDPGSVQLRDLTDAGAVIAEQRFVPGATTPTEVLARHVGEPVTVVTPRGEVAGTLRSVDDQVIVVEAGTGDQRRLQVMRRDGYVQDVRLAAGAGDRPSLVWRLRSARPGKHTVEVSYRAEGMSWTADYLAVLDEAGKAIDFSAWATIRNATGASYDAADVTLISGGAPPAAPAGSSRSGPARFAIPAQVRIGHGDAVQVALVPPRVAAPARSIIMFEAMADPSPGLAGAPGADCNQFNGASLGTGTANVAFEVDIPGQTMLPDGKARLFQRRAGRLELVAEDALRSGAGVARIRVAPASGVVGERHAVSCDFDERGHTVREAIEIEIENRTRQTADVIVREYLWRWPVWHLEAEDRKGVRAGPQVQEYRLRVPGNGNQTVTYTVVYTW
jgi:hypothetical protein